MNGLVVDLFAGGGGASTGIEAALGRFWSLVARTAVTKRGCWEWRGDRQRRPSGQPSYGIFCVGKRRFLAHRFAVLVDGRSIAPGQVVRHACDNPACVRPEHLVVGTQAENLADMRAKGRAHFNRFPAGTAHPKAKLTTDEVAALRRDRASGLSFVKLGAKYGIHPSTAHAIATGETRRTA